MSKLRSAMQKGKKVAALENTETVKRTSKNKVSSVKEGKHLLDFSD